MEGRSPNHRGLRVLAVLFLPAVSGASALLVARLAGRRPPFVLLVAAGVVLLSLTVLAAALAGAALVRRRWHWAAGLLLAWPFVVPFELWRRSGEAES